MGEFIEDWSLQAIVRGSSGDYTKIVDVGMDGHSSSFDIPGSYQQQFDQEFLASFPEIFEVSTTGSGDELEDLYKPFYPGAHSVAPQAVVELQEQRPENVAEEKQADESNRAGRVAAAGYTPKYKRRKNQHKRVVIQVSADDLASDMWAWRKYGQKPIKGSPYPRSYYRCSSSKGCLARKQVEQSCADPGMFIITYTAEHSHSQPTRRNSLAGTIRQKFPSSKSSNSRIIKLEKTEESSNASSSKPLQPVSATEVVLPAQTKINSMEYEAGVVGESHGDADSMPDLIFNDDFFSGFKDFDQLISEMPVCHTSV